MPENEDRSCFTGIKESRKKTAEKVSFRGLTENSQGGCRRDMSWYLIRWTRFHGRRLSATKLFPGKHSRCATDRGLCKCAQEQPGWRVGNLRQDAGRHLAGDTREAHTRSMLSTHGQREAHACMWPRTKNSRRYTRHTFYYLPTSFLRLYTCEWVSLCVFLCLWLSWLLSAQRGNQRVPHAWVGNRK